MTRTAIEGRRARADASVARRFSRAMRAATVPWGPLSDPALCAVAVAVAVAFAAFGLGAPRLRLAVVLAPIAAGVLADVAALRARRRVVDWLAALPFPVENVNALLNGVGSKLLVHFAAGAPDRASLNAMLERVHEDSFALEYLVEGAAAVPGSGYRAASGPETVEVAIGVPDSKLNPSRAAYRRYRRVRALVDDCLVPLDQTHRIVGVWIG
jgi:hypothetical protein